MAASRVERMNDIVGMIMSEGGLSPADLLVLMADHLASVPPEQLEARVASLRSRVDEVRSGLMDELVTSIGCDCFDCTELRGRAQAAAFQQAGAARVVRRFRGPVGEA